MKKSMKAGASVYWVLVSLWLAETHAQATVICDLHQFCPMGGSCACVVPATSAFNRSFYFNVATFYQGKHYQCFLQGGPSHLWADMAGSQFPEGSRVRCQGSCAAFPLTLWIDTAHMQNRVGLASVKYSVPATDVPNNVSITCQSSGLS